MVNAMKFRLDETDPTSGLDPIVTLADLVASADPTVETHGLETIEASFDGHARLSRLRKRDDYKLWKGEWRSRLDSMRTPCFRAV